VALFEAPPAVEIAVAAMTSGGNFEKLFFSSSLVLRKKYASVYVNGSLFRLTYFCEQGQGAFCMIF
jgi:hypothetical protein